MPRHLEDVGEVRVAVDETPVRTSPNLPDGDFLLWGTSRYRKQDPGALTRALRLAWKPTLLVPD